MMLSCSGILGSKSKGLGRFGAINRKLVNRSLQGLGLRVT